MFLEFVHYYLEGEREEEKGLNLYKKEEARGRRGEKRRGKK